MNKPITTLALFAAILMSAATTNGAAAQNAQWNALFDRIIRLEANVKNMARNGGGNGGYQQTQSNDQMRQVLNEIRQMRQQLLTMDARLRRLEKNSGRSGAVHPRQPTYRQQAQLPTRLPANNPTFAETDLNQYRVNNEPQIFVEIGKPKDHVARSQGVPVAPIARAPIARAPANWQAAAPVVPPVTPAIVPQGTQKLAGLPPQTNGVVRQTLDGNQITQQSVAKKLYDRSASALLSRRYGAAESGFKSFLRKYGSHDLASGAQFMLGETYYIQRNWRLAAQSYLKGYRKYPQGTRAGDTLLKLGMSLGKLGQKSQSCGAFETVVSKYKSSGSAVAQAKKEMKRARCQG